MVKTDWSSPQIAPALGEHDGALPPRRAAGVTADHRDVLLLEVGDAGARRQRDEVADEGDDVVLGHLLLYVGLAGGGIAPVVLDVDVHGMSVEASVCVDVGLPDPDGLLRAREDGPDDAAVGADVAQVDRRVARRGRGAAGCARCRRAVPCAAAGAAEAPVGTAGGRGRGRRRAGRAGVARAPSCCLTCRAPGWCRRRRCRLGAPSPGRSGGGPPPRCWRGGAAATAGEEERAARDGQCGRAESFREAPARAGRPQPAAGDGDVVQGVAPCGIPLAR